jgi:hypothetical protein
MIATFAFRGKEYWCWNCGNTETMFNSLENREISEEEEAELLVKVEESKDFLNARGMLCGGGMKKRDGKYLSFDELPKEEQELIEKQAKSWNYVEGD